MVAKRQRAKRTPKSEPREVKRVKILKVRSSEEELARFREVAEKRGLTVAELVRTVINKECE